MAAKDVMGDDSPSPPGAHPGLVVAELAAIRHALRLLLEDEGLVGAEAAGGPVPLAPLRAGPQRPTVGRAREFWRMEWLDEDRRAWGLGLLLAAMCNWRQMTERDPQALAQAHGYFRSAPPGAESKSRTLRARSHFSLFPLLPCRERNAMCRTISPPTAPSGTPGPPTSPPPRIMPTPRSSVPAAPACAASSARRWEQCGAVRCCIYSATWVRTPSRGRGSAPR